MALPLHGDASRPKLRRGLGAAAFPKAPPGWVGFAPPGAYSEAETLPAPLRLAPARAGPSTSSRSFLMSLFANSFPPRHRQSPQHRQGQPPVLKTSPGWSPPAPRCPRGGCRRSRGCWCRRTAGGPAPKPAGGSEVRPSPLVLATLGQFCLGGGAVAPLWTPPSPRRVPGAGEASALPRGRGLVFPLRPGGPHGPHQLHDGPHRLQALRG